MSVELQPTELAFRRPFNHETVQKLLIRNPHHDPVAFKVKTTAPKQYCVRPNSGRIEAGKEVEVAVLLQAMKEDPPPDFRCRDKFLVQSVPITADQEYSQVGQIWSEVEKTARSSIQEKKIRVTYLSADSTAAPELANYDNQTKSPSPPPYSSPGPEKASKPEPSSTTHQNRDVVSEGEQEIHDSHETAPDAAKTMAEQLAEAKAHILTLTTQLKESAKQKSLGELAADTKGKVTAGVTNIGRSSQGPEGVPVQLAAALCLVAFLLAYFFF